MIEPQEYELLKGIDSPDQLKLLSESQLPQLADELRSYLIDCMGRTGGHFAAGLGTVELTVALHYVFNTPDDRLIWDVGHQTYPHKILTGRRDAMSTLRQKEGISGFPNRFESEYDAFGVGHSSTSISAALGMAVAAKLQGSSRKSIAVIGDGAMTAGMAFEALNNAGHSEADLLVILNDNDMSISHNVGALSNYLAKLLSGSVYSGLRNRSKRFLQHIPNLGEFVRRSEEHMKGMFMPGTLFEELGFNYIGPVDGHDLSALIPTLQNVAKLSGPQFLHVVTKKGKGYALAEKDPIGYHSIGKFDPSMGKPPAVASAPTYTEIFGSWLCHTAETDKRLIAITPAMREGSGLVEFSRQFPDQYVDVAISEQHSVTFAAGLACDGMKPVVAIYSTFLQRAYDQAAHDVALQNLDVLFAIDRAGIVGPDGATHAGTFDISFLRCLPNVVIMAPADENECHQMLTTGYHYAGPAAVRYPRGTGIGATVAMNSQPLPIGKGEIIKEGEQIAILSFGCLLAEATAVAETLNATVANMKFIKPLDEALVLSLARQHSLLVTIEDGAVMGGAGSAVLECLAKNNVLVSVINLGLPDRFIEHASRQEILSECGLDQQGILKAINQHPSLK